MRQIFFSIFCIMKDHSNNTWHSRRGQQSVTWTVYAFFKHNACGGKYSSVRARLVFKRHFLSTSFHCSEDTSLWKQLFLKIKCHTREGRGSEKCQNSVLFVKWSFSNQFGCSINYQVTAFLCIWLNLKTFYYEILLLMINQI